MPYRSTRSRRTYRRQAPKRSRFRSRSRYPRRYTTYKSKVHKGLTAVNSHTIGLPKTMIQKFKWSQNGCFIPISPYDPIFQRYQMSSPFDPDVTSDVPGLWNQLVNDAMYRRFICYKTTYKLTLRNRSTTNFSQYLVAYGEANDVSQIDSAITDNVKCFEAREISSAYGGVLAPLGSPGCYKTHTGTITPSMVYGVPKSAIYNDINYSGAFNANPSRSTWMTVVGASDPCSAQTEWGIGYELEVIFHCKLTDLADTYAQT